MKKRRPLTPGQRRALEAVALLTERLGRSPSEREVGNQLGIGKAGARYQLLECHRRGYMSAPRQTVVGGWAVNRAGQLELDKGDT